MGRQRIACRPSSAIAGSVKRLTRSHDPETLEDGPKDVGLDEGVGWEADRHKGAMGPKVLKGVVVGRAAGCRDDRRLNSSIMSVASPARC